MEIIVAGRYPCACPRLRFQAFYLHARNGSIVETEGKCCSEPRSPRGAFSVFCMPRFVKMLPRGRWGLCMLFFYQMLFHI
ncbi:unnamed protein product [Amoebophrya sp. A120]|nr:unnamed protein product [Amoebophrya sp. A120]|eukprot:GSA120T00008433001.1